MTGSHTVQSPFIIIGCCVLNFPFITQAYLTYLHILCNSFLCGAAQIQIKNEFKATIWRIYLEKILSVNPA